MRQLRHRSGAMAIQTRKAAPRRRGCAVTLLDVLEVYCHCAPEIAVRRFKHRQRHPGHCDALRAPTLDAQFERLAAAGPLGVGELVEIDTGDGWDVAAAVGRVCAAWRRSQL